MMGAEDPRMASMKENVDRAESHLAPRAQARRAEYRHSTKDVGQKEPRAAATTGNNNDERAFARLYDDDDDDDDQIEVLLIQWLSLHANTPPPIVVFPASILILVFGHDKVINFVFILLIFINILL